MKSVNPIHVLSLISQAELHHQIHLKFIHPSLFSLQCTAVLVLFHHLCHLAQKATENSIALFHSLLNIIIKTLHKTSLILRVLTWPKVYNINGEIKQTYSTKERKKEAARMKKMSKKLRINFDEIKVKTTELMCWLIFENILLTLADMRS
jgi:hypothetical protein